MTSPSWAQESRSMMGERRMMEEALLYGFGLERHDPDNPAPAGVMSSLILMAPVKSSSRTRAHFLGRPRGLPDWPGLKLVERRPARGIVCHCGARHHIVVGHHRGGFSPPAAVMTATIMSPVATRRTPALTPKVLSIVNSSTRNNAPPQTPGTFALPPDTDVPPMTTTAIEAKRYSLPMSTFAPRK